jgi:tetratricopeptide (TPR) repeat protein
MKRAAGLILALLAACLFAAADPAPAADTQEQAKDFVRFGKQDLAHGLATSAFYYFNQATTLQPGSADAWAGKAHALDLLKRYDEAKTASDKAVELAPASPASWAVQGKILFDQKHYSEALTALNKSLALNNADTAVYRWKGETLDSLGRHDEALNAYEKAKPPYEPYRGGITRITSGGPKGTEIESNTTGTPEEQPTPGKPEGALQSTPADVYVYVEPQETEPYSDFGISYYEPSYLYGGNEGHGHGGRHRAYGGYYYEGYEDGSIGSPLLGTPRTVAPYRGVEPLYQQGVVPQYWQGVVPETDFHDAPDYHGAGGEPYISDRYHAPRGGRHFGGRGRR